MSNPLLRLRYRIEYIALRCTFLLLDHLSPVGCCRFATFCGWVYYTVSLHRRHVARENILRCGITSNPREARRIARASFVHFATIIVESFKAGEWITDENWRDHLVIDFSPKAEAYSSDPAQGIIIGTGHVGNWEIAAQIFTFVKPVVAVARRMNNPLTDKLIREHTPRTRFEVLDKRKLNPKRFISALQEGKAMSMLVDQYAGRSGTMASFFGIPASSHTSAARLHLLSGAPLFCGCCVREGPMFYRLIAEDPIMHEPTGDRDADVRAVMEAMNRQLERVIRRYPEQYVWAHRRWREE